MAAYMSSPCHIEFILSEKEEPVKKEVCFFCPHEYISVMLITWILSEHIDLAKLSKAAITLIWMHLQNHPITLFLLN
jgi:hypothetical protein